MQTIVMRDKQLHLEEVAAPVPGPGQVLVKSLACGICGSDIHMLKHADDYVPLMKQEGMMDSEASVSDFAVSLGHEFCAEVVAYGPETSQQLPVGTRVTSIPFILDGEEQVGIGVGPGLYGAYSEYFILTESLMIPVPEQLPSEAAALTEPLAVGLHSVNVADQDTDTVALVAGCGPIGLACIIALQQRGVKTIIASDPQEDKRQLAETFGATHTVDPQSQDEFALLAEIAGESKTAVYECVGIPKMIPDLIRRTPAGSTVVFTGIHSSSVTIEPMHATMKELVLKFSFYYTPEDFVTCLEMLNKQEIPWQKLITGRVGIDSVEGAFDALMSGGEHTKVIIEPWRKGSLQAYI
ncbi:zinc-binding dehydrogenase [Pseudomaricurvus alkylphenolicus]|uniref:zinc-binding dehydrogenase n=1 Tax=Pseudomaricurvus alkylphenolicus TaxID=1306991 RepID=UPI001421B942|nr:zinc-binding dehydrogenase [Pseudomaricurvus alkylphenolicus]NIB44670.1 zinc-binding dehydrogenase [Pseudomaricurvus alkylphenolicus]